MYLLVLCILLAKSPLVKQVNGILPRWEISGAVGTVFQPAITLRIDPINVQAIVYNVQAASAYKRDLEEATFLELSSTGSP